MARKLTRRSFLKVAGVSATTLAVAACAAPGPAAAPAEGDMAEGAPSAERVEIEFMNWWGSHREALMDEAIANFHDVNSDVQVNNSVQPWDGRAERAATAVASNNPPALIMTQRVETYQFAHENLILPIDDYVQASGIDPDAIFYAGEINNQRWQGQLYSFPLPTGGGNTGQYFYNKTVLAEAGLDPETPVATWQELTEASRAITQKDDLGVTVMGANLGGGPVGFGQWLYGNAGQFVSDDARTIMFDSPQGIETLEWMVDFTNEINGGIDNANEFFAGTSDTSADHPYYNEKLGFLFTGVWQFGHLQATDPDMWADTSTWGVGQMPYNGNNPDAAHAGVAGLAGSWGYVIPASTPQDQADAAYQWLEFFGTHEQGGCLFLFNQGRPSPVAQCNENAAYYDDNPYWSVVLKSLASDVSVAVTPVQARINDVVGTVVDEAYFGQHSPADALAKGAEESQRILDEFWSG